MKKFVSILTAVMLIAGIAVFSAGCGGNSSEGSNGESGGSGNSGSKVDLNDYVTVSFYGADGDGFADYSFDSMGFVDDCSEIISYKDAEPSASAAMSLAQYLTDSGSFDISEGLSNGDKVVFKWNLDEDELKSEYEMNFSYKDAEYTVEDLLISDVPEETESSDEEQAEGESESKSDSDAEEDDPMKQAQKEAQEENEGADEE